MISISKNVNTDELKKLKILCHGNMQQKTLMMDLLEHFMKQESQKISQTDFRF